uniref:Alternative protein PALLD n=1 Tax=Homo sapiens TaxID=9606 RepID=L0R8B3_HUMAN|nr:alternative protein PALLD [Homo sapiens]
MLGGILCQPRMKQGLCPVLPGWTFTFLDINSEPHQENKYPTQWHQQSQSTKPKKVRPSASRYAALSDQGLDIKAAFQPEANPSHLTLNTALVESEDL